MSLPTSSLARRRWLSLVWRLSIGLVLSMCIIAALVIAIVAKSSASGTATCVNDVLGDRNGTTATDAAAHIRFARESKKYDDALARALQAPSGSAEQRQAFAAFINAAQGKQDADDAYIRTLTANRDFREKHPLGRC